jgi:hypothetical protein
MKRKALSLSEIVEHRLLPPKLQKELMTGLLPVKLNPTKYQEQEGYKRIMIATEAIKRLGYE